MQKLLVAGKTWEDHAGVKHELGKLSQVQWSTSLDGTLLVSSKDCIFSVAGKMEEGVCIVLDLVVWHMDDPSSHPWLSKPEYRSLLLKFPQLTLPHPTYHNFHLCGTISSFSGVVVQMSITRFILQQLHIRTRTQAARGAWYTLFAHAWLMLVKVP